MKYLPISIEDIEHRPDQFAITLGNVQLIFRVSWNPIDEAFFFDLFDNEGAYIIAGRRIVYANDMLAGITDDRLPEGVSIYPADPSGEADEIGITFDNFMNSVKPWIIEVGE
ncbi:hypothetical protein GM661_00565 [Iocasia frigidifontis]|uniref:Cyanophage baseplate Pam3 plug gp18 domain-containing protein n=1 Tax=Iocasia fonsfrigidae TaxID=2682810 RepID=A0A8A7K4E0_9FIRM|nr:hypothetical protein [Iocasia fonsfrigidae]QTL96566.1 hypothetical protein GM661_00565 [Iocasia fonsfrigidae]